MALRGSQAWCGEAAESMVHPFQITTLLNSGRCVRRRSLAAGKPLSATRIG